MSPASDDPPSDRISTGAPIALPEASGGSEPAGSAGPQTADEKVKGADPQGVMVDTGEPPALPRPRRRRRRRRPREVRVAETVASGQNEHEERAAAGEALQPGARPAEPAERASPFAPGFARH